MDKEKSQVGYMAVTSGEQSNQYLKMNSKIMREAFKGEVTDVPVKFPKELGAEHPFRFDEVERASQRVGIVNAAVDKITDAIVGDFTVSVDDPNSQAILNDFIHDSNFIATLKPWVKEGILKGNGFLELDLEEGKVRVMNSNSMYVKRNNKGQVKEYTQFKGNKERLIVSKNNTIIFKPKEIAHFIVNKVPNDPYGLGIVWPNMLTINNFASSELGRHKLLDRKAGAPIHVRIGQPGESIQTKDIDDFKEKLQYMNNSTEWVTDGNIDMKVIDFQGATDSLSSASRQDLELIAMGMQIPLVLLGVANIPEGLAKAQSESFQRFIGSIRIVLEDLIESQILRPILRENNLDGFVEFEWELPGETEKNDRLRVLGESMRNPFMSPPLKAAIELEYAQVLGLEDAEKILVRPQDAEEAERVRQEEEEIPQPEVPGAKPTANQGAKTPGILVKPDVKVTEIPKKELTESQLDDMTVAEYVNLTEIEGFNYVDYLTKILINLKTEKFEELLAITESDIEVGLLPKKDINKLRVVLTNGFRKNKPMREIAKDIEQNVPLKDRVKVKDGKEMVTLSAKQRPIVIARTQTTRAANEGLKSLYTENNIKHYRYLAALDDRTSEICNELNGQVFPVSEGSPGLNMPPMHVNCRSSIVGLVD